jgi:hypothetical protein
LGDDVGSNVIFLTQGRMHRAGLTFADDNGLLPASANPQPQEK